MRNRKLNVMIKVSILGVIALLLQFIEVPIPIFPDFLKIDISDLPALIGAFALGPVHGVAIELLKNILHGIFKGGTAFIGEFANFLIGSVLVISAGTIYKRNKNKTNAILGLAVGTIAMSIAAGLLNYFVLLPLYEKVLNFPIKAVVAMGNKVNHNITDLNSFIIWAILPFNIIKGILISALTVAVYKSVSPIIHREASEEKKYAN